MYFAGVDHKDFRCKALDQLSAPPQSMRLHFAGTDARNDFNRTLDVEQENMRLYFAGAGNKDQYSDILDEEQATVVHGRQIHRLGSYWYLRKFAEPVAIGPKWYDYPTFLLDSGGFSALASGVKPDVYALAEFINVNGIKTSFNLDVPDSEISKRNQTILERECPGCYIIPVYHLFDFYSTSHRPWIDEMLERYPFVGLGGMVTGRIPIQRKTAFLDYVFAKTRHSIRVHGLGIGNKDLMERYPFFSVDSTGWLSGGRFGRTAGVRDGRVHEFLNNKIPYQERTRISINWYLDLQEHITKLWQSRGITWPQERPRPLTNPASAGT